MKQGLLLCLVFCLAFVLANTQKDIVETLEHEVGERVKAARELDMKNNDIFDRTVALKFALKGHKNEDGEFYQHINQIQALYWQDPAWDTYTPAWAEEGSRTTVSVISSPDITSLHAGRPATYAMRYDVTYRKNPELPGTEGFVVNGGQLVEAGSPSRDVAQRTVEVTPIDWAKCLNEPFDESVKDCRFIQYLNRESCRNFSPRYFDECSVFHEWSGIIPDDAGPVSPTSPATSTVVNEIDEATGKPTGRFFLQCKDQDAVLKTERRMYGLFHFPKEGSSYMPICSPCQKRGICRPFSVCKDLGAGDYECVCVAGYDKDSLGDCVRNHTNPEILLRFKNRHQSITKLKQCGRYVEEGYDVVVGNNPGNPGNHYVDVEYPPELAAELIRHHGEFEVSYWLKGTSDTSPPVTRHVLVEQVNRCGLKHCGEACPDNTLCRHRSGESYPSDIECACYQPRQCSNPDDMVEEPLPAFYEAKANVSREYHRQKVSEDYAWHLPATRCYEESGEGEKTICEDVAPPVIYYKDYKDAVVTCRVCNTPLAEGAFVEPDCWFFDFNDGRPEKCKWETSDLRKMDDRYSVQDVKLIARDSKGLESTVTIQLYHEIEDISVEIKELIEFRKQMRDFEAAIESLLYWIMVIALTFVMILLVWLALTAEGMLFFRVLCRKITSPSTSWAHLEAEVHAEDIFAKRNPNSPARRR